MYKIIIFVQYVEIILGIITRGVVFIYCDNGLFYYQTVTLITSRSVDI